MKSKSGVPEIDDFERFAIWALKQKKRCRGRSCYPSFSVNPEHECNNCTLIKQFRILEADDVS